MDSQPVAVITMTAVMRGAKPIGLKNIVDDALKLAAKAPPRPFLQYRICSLQIMA